MRWVKRLLLGLLGVLVVVAIGAGWLVLQARTEPEFLRGAAEVTPEEASGIVARLTADPSPGEAPLLGAPPAGPSSAPPRARPYEIVLSERDVAAVVLANSGPELRAAVTGLRVRIRERDLVAAGTIRQEPLRGRTAWIDVRPSVGRGGALCLRFGTPHLGGAEIPDAILRELAGGRKVPRVACVSPRGRLPGPLRSVRIAAGTVVLRGARAPGALADRPAP